MGLVAISFYTLSNHISIFRRFHLSYKAQKEKNTAVFPRRFLAKIAIVLFLPYISGVFRTQKLAGNGRVREAGVSSGFSHQQCLPWSMRRQNVSMLRSSKLSKQRRQSGFVYLPCMRGSFSFHFSLHASVGLVRTVQRVLHITRRIAMCAYVPRDTREIFVQQVTF